MTKTVIFWDLKPKARAAGFESLNVCFVHCCNLSEFKNVFHFGNSKLYFPLAKNVFSRAAAAADVMLLRLHLVICFIYDNELRGNGLRQQLDYVASNMPCSLVTTNCGGLPQLSSFGDLNKFCGIWLQRNVIKIASSEQGQSVEL